MLYFFHRYELPVIMQQAQVLILNRNQNDGGGGGGANIVAGILQQQQQHPQQQQAGQANRNGVGQQQQPGTFVANRIFRLVPLPQQQLNQQHGNAAGQHGVQVGAGGGQVDGLQIQPQQLPFVGGLLQHYAGQNVGGALGMIRRALFARGWRQPIRVRIQTAGNLQRINLGSIQINPENLARVSPTPSPTQAATDVMASMAAGAAPSSTATNTESTRESTTNASSNSGYSTTTTISSNIFNSTGELFFLFFFLSLWFIVPQFHFCCLF